METDTTYLICVKGHLDERWLRWFEDLTVSQKESGETWISGPITDQAALFGVLNRIRDLGLELLLVQKQDSNEETDPGGNSIGRQEHERNL